MSINHIFESESYFKHNRVVSLYIFVVMNPSENLKRAVDSPQKKNMNRSMHTCGEMICAIFTLVPSYV